MSHENPPHLRSPSSEAVYRWHPNVASRVLDGVAFILLNARMLRLNAVGTKMWEQFENGATLPAVVSAITREYEVSADVAARDTERFAADLIERGMLVSEHAYK